MAKTPEKAKAKPATKKAPAKAEVKKPRAPRKKAEPVVEEVKLPYVPGTIEYLGSNDAAVQTSNMLDYHIVNPTSDTKVRVTNAVTVEGLGLATHSMQNVFQFDVDVAYSFLVKGIGGYQYDTMGFDLLSEEIVASLAKPRTMKFPVFVRLDNVIRTAISHAQVHDDRYEHDQFVEAFVNLVDGADSCNEQVYASILPHPMHIVCEGTAYSPSDARKLLVNAIKLAVANAVWPLIDLSGGYTTVKLHSANIRFNSHHNFVSLVGGKHV